MNDDRMPDWMKAKLDPTKLAASDASARFIEDFDAATLRLPARPRGHYLGMSGIGQCPRLQWFRFHHPNRLSEPSPRLRRIFELGHACEDQAMRIMFRMDGITVLTTQAEYSDFDGRFRGHSDVVFRWAGLPGVKIVGDWKTMNARRFGQFKKEGLRASNEVYFAQLMVYAFYEHAEWVALLAYCKDTSEIEAEFLPYDDEAAQMYRRRAELILTSSTPPECTGGRFCECRNA